MTDEIVTIPAPTGSYESKRAPTFGPVVVGTEVLDALANNATSQSMSYENISGEPLASVEIILNPITPTQGGLIQIVSGDVAYEFVFRSEETTARRIVFAKIPSAFLQNFSVRNLSGDSFAAKGNYIMVNPQY